jgi:hypothetical protein
MFSANKMPVKIAQIGDCSMSAQKSLRGCPIALCLKKDINNLAIAINSPPHVAAGH